MILYPTIEAAATAALTAAYECGGERYECGGVIYKVTAGGFTFTPPITDHKRFGVVIPYLYSVPVWPGRRLSLAHLQHPQLALRAFLLCERCRRERRKSTSTADANSS